MVSYPAVNHRDVAGIVGWSMTVEAGGAGKIVKDCRES
jgi:hypothetical protein